MIAVAKLVGAVTKLVFYFHKWVLYFL